MNRTMMMVMGAMFIMNRVSPCTCIFIFSANGVAMLAL
jgi:hypothetical protein